MNLHELRRIKQEAPVHQFLQRAERDLFCEQPFLPMTAVGTEDGFDVVFIHIRVVRAGIAQGASLLIEQDDLLLDCQGNLGIRDHGRQKEGVGGPAFGTFHPADPQEGFPARIFHGTAVVSVDRKASVVAAGTFQPVEREEVDGRFINIFGNIVAISDSDGYHSIVAG